MKGDATLLILKISITTSHINRHTDGYLSTLFLIL